VRHTPTRDYERKEGEKVSKATPSVKSGIRFYRLQLKQVKGEKEAGQEAMAVFVGRPRYLISQWEKGEAFPSPAEVIKLAEFLEVTPGHLYTAKQLEALHVLYGPQEGGE